MESIGVLPPLHATFIFCPLCYTEVRLGGFTQQFSSSNAAGTNGCLDLNCHSCPLSRDKNLLCRRCSGF